MSRKIISICGRAETGISRPFFCEADDGHFYFVKCDNITHEQRVLEFIFSRLADAFGLPAAQVEIVEIPEELSAYALVERAEEFQPGLAVGSRRIPFSDDVRTSHLRHIHEETKQRCLCFDWWVRNSDRCLELVGGDPNVLWDPILQSVFLIDHDRCLDMDFDPNEFKRQHVFRDSRPFIEKEMFERWRTKFESTIYGLGDIWSEIPGEWLVDDSGTALVPFGREEIEAQLMKPEFSTEGILPA